MVITLDDDGFLQIVVLPSGGHIVSSARRSIGIIQDSIGGCKCSFFFFTFTLHQTLEVGKGIEYAGDRQVVE